MLHVTDDGSTYNITNSYEWDKNQSVFMSCNSELIWWTDIRASCWGIGRPINR